MPKKFIALALDEDQCRAVMAACHAATVQIESMSDTFERALEGSGKTKHELIGLYARIVIYVAEKLEREGL